MYSSRVRYPTYSAGRVSDAFDFDIVDSDHLAVKCHSADTYNDEGVAIIEWLRGHLQAVRQPEITIQALHARFDTGLGCLLDGQYRW